MNEEGKFHLTNTDFESNASTVFNDLYNDQIFTDVTLACEDGKTVKAHKIVLSASSDVFHKILTQYSHTNPLIYFGDTSYKHIEYMMRYVYVGEVSVEEIELDQFIETANKFKIKGIHSNELQKNHLDKTDGHHREENSLKSIENEDKNYPFMTDQSNIDNSEAASFNCDRCNYKTTRKEYLRIHKRSIHDGVKYPCNECDYKATQSGSLLQHKLSVHDGVKYQCAQCDYKARSPSKLNIHVREKHEGIEYPCVQCNHKEPNRKKLNLHVKSVHEGVKYSCNQCDYTNVSRNPLKRHQEMVHFGLRFLCDVDKCEFSSINRSRLRKHKSNEHSEQIKVELD